MDREALAETWRERRDDYALSEMTVQDWCDFNRGLAVLVSHSFELDLFSNSLFVFCNRDRDKLKILFWDHNGFWLDYRRLEKGRFRWPALSETATRSVSRRQLQWLLDGLPREHKPVDARVAA